MRKYAIAGVFILLLVAGLLVACGAEPVECPTCPDCVCPEVQAPAPDAYAIERIGIHSYEDVKLYNGADFYMYSDDKSTQKFHLDGATGNIDAEGTMALAGAPTFEGKLTVNDAGLFDGDSDEVQFTVQAYTTQTNSAFVIENSSAVDLFTVSGVGDVLISGTTPLLTIGDAGEEDTAIVFDGAAQDFHIGLDDTADDLVFGKGAALGTTTAFAIDENQVTTWSGGTLVLVEDVTAVNTLTASECGKTMFLNSGTEFATTLPAISTVSAGCEFRFVVKAAPSGASYTIITGNSLENVLIGGINELEVDTNDDGPYQAAGDTITITDTLGVVGDWVYMISDGSSFYVTGQANKDGGVEISQAD